MANLVAVLNQKGGVGKTTTVINLAAYLAKAGKTVLVVDFDPQGNATSGLGLDKQQGLTVYDVLFREARLQSVVRPTYIKNLHLLPANNSLAAAEVELATQPQRELWLKNHLANLDYDFILIDCPPSLGLLSINALVAANWLLVPVQAEYYALEGLGQLLEVWQRVRQGLNPGLELLGVLLTMNDKRTSLAAQVHGELKKHFDKKLFDTIIPRSIRLAEAPSHGKAAADYDKWSKGARAYKQLTKEVTDRVKK